MNTTDTISELRSLAVAAGDVITLLGYYEKGDKPAIIYYFKEGNFVDDGGSVIVPSNPPLNGAWIAIFSNEVFIEDFGVSETNPNNSQSILNAIKMNKKLISKENKKYLINSTLNINGADIDLKLGKNTVFYSVPITTSGLEAKKVIHWCIWKLF
ncbi:hypothetical protein [Chryseobacterium tongliaoense]|uniref:hypothetical protein n=1 Tax=Chryseobacterium tongliaoense TaxID=3240933 RepID=UPI003512DC24